MNRLVEKAGSPGLRRSMARRCGLTLGIGTGAALLLAAMPDDASATALGGAATSFGLVAALSAVLVMKAWQTHLLAGSLATVLGLLALFGGAALIWRLSGAPRTHRLVIARPVAAGYHRAEASTRAMEIPLPEGVDRQLLLADLRRTFLALQTAWDQGAGEELRQMTTPDMLDELSAARAAGYGMAHRSEVLTLHVNLIAFERVGEAQLVCVEFSGSICDSPPSLAEPFREFWMLTRALDGGAGWQLAKHQALL